MLKQTMLFIIRFLVGGLFIFSGLIKVNDPVGTAIKLEEYFDVFSNDIASFFSIFKDYALEIAVFLVVAEVVLGVMLILGVRLKLTVWALGIMILFFTLWFANFAEAIAVTALDAAHAGKTYELAGDLPHSMADFAAEVSRQTGKTIPYNNLPQDVYAGILQSFGLPEGFADGELERIGLTAVGAIIGIDLTESLPAKGDQP